jgi:uncharacterized Zn-finger protein
VNNKTNLLRFSHICNVGDHLYLKCLHPVCYALSGTDQSKRLFCKFCGKGFWYEHNLQRHIKVIHGPHEENFHCSYCGKGFNMKSAMVTHVQQVHFNIFPFHCNECSVGFKLLSFFLHVFPLCVVLMLLTI